MSIDIRVLRQIEHILHEDISDTRKVVNRTIECAVTSTGANWGCFYRYDAKKERLECRDHKLCKSDNENVNNNCTINLKNDDDFVVKVLRGKTAQINNIIKDNERIKKIEKLLKLEINSEVAIPLFGKADRPFGVLTLYSDKGAYFIDDHLDILMTICDIGSAAFQNSNVLRKLEMLSDASDVLLKEYENKSTDEKFDFIIKKMIEILDAELCSLFLVNDNKLELKTSYSVENGFNISKRESEKKELPILDGEKVGITGYIAFHKKPFNCFGEELRNHPAIKNKERTEFLPSKYNYSELAYPILDDNSELLGLVIAYNKLDETGKPFISTGFSKAYDEPFMKILTTKLLISIKNADLIASKDKVINELKALGKIQETITTSLDLDKILECVLDVVVNTLGFNYATISKVDYTKNQIGTISGLNVPAELIPVAWHSLDSNDIQACVVRNKKIERLDGWDERLDLDIYQKFGHKNLVRIYLPILIWDKVFGTLECGYFKTTRQQISDEEVEILKKVVNLAGIGLSQASLRDAQEELVNQLQALNQATIYIQAAQNVDEVANQIFKSLEQIGYSKGMLSLVNKSKGFIEGRYALGKSWQTIISMTKRDLAGNDILAISLREKQSLISKDCFTDHRCNTEALKVANIRSQYVIPLFSKEEPLGTIQIDLSDMQGLVKGPEDFLKSRMEVLETFARQIAIAIRNVRDREIINLLEQTLMETAHEFRSPLHNILTQVGSLKYILDKELKQEKEIDEILKVIDEEATRASKQMDNTLLYSGRSRGVMGYNFADGFIQDLIQQCVSCHRLRALERGISIIIKDSIKKLPGFRFDKTKIEQVLNNLIDNAVKYSHFNRFIQIHGFDDGTKIHIEILDKGQGIPEAEYDSIFEGFTRGSVKDKIRYIPGTGLGLRISREIVRGHGGEIKVKSTPFFDDPKKRMDYDGYDTTFTIILPKKPKGE
jgi:signal transduction histidine kinase